MSELKLLKCERFDMGEKTDSIETLLRHSNRFNDNINIFTQVMYYYVVQKSCINPISKLFISSLKN